MKSLRESLFLSAVVLLAGSILLSHYSALNVQAQEQAKDGAVSAKETTGGGLKTTTFETPEGKLAVNFPDDMSATDTISGTVVADAKGDTPEDKAKNEDEISGYVVEVAKTEEVPRELPQTVVELPKKEKKKEKKAPPTCSSKSPDFTCLIPPAVGVISLILRNRQGKKICETPMTCNPTPPPAPCPPGECIMPTVGSCGRPVQIKGPCDGMSSTGSVKIGNEIAKPLAESPRQQIVKSPKNIVGQTTIERKEGGTVTTGKFNNVRVKLAAGKVGLQKGESTTITVRVEGLEGLKGPVKLHIENRSIDVVSMEGGNVQEINIDTGNRAPINY
jgi:hypothetical protein